MATYLEMFREKLADHLVGVPDTAASLVEAANISNFIEAIEFPMELKSLALSEDEMSAFKWEFGGQISVIFSKMCLDTMLGRVDLLFNTNFREEFEKASTSLTK